MAHAFPANVPRRHVFRVTFGTNPLALRPWNTVQSTEPMTGRWDDPEAQYRVLYTSSSERGALREAMQNFRPVSTVPERLHALIEVPVDREFGTVPLSWLATRTISRIRVESGRCVPVCTEPALEAVYRHCGIHFSPEELLSETGLPWTRYISRMIWRKRIYSGIEVPSKFGIDLHNYGFFEARPQSNVLRAKLEPVHTRPLVPDDSALVAAVRVMGLRIEQPVVSLLAA